MTSDPSAVAALFFRALEADDWRAAAELVDEEALGDIRVRQLSSIVGWVEHHDAARRAMEQGFAYGWSTRGSLDPQRMESFATTRLDAFRGSPTLGELAALAPVQFCAVFFEAVGRAVGPYRVFGHVFENDDLAHVIYRAEGGRYRDSIQVEVFQVRRRASIWRVVPDYYITFGIMLQLDRNADRGQ